MELINEFAVEVPVERAWAVLTDVETIAPCLPGAQLQEIDGDDFRGVVKVKVGPITATYKGTATFVELDESRRRVVLRAEGHETRGQGNASALITAELVSSGAASTDVRVTTDLTVSGKVAQFGRGVMADVSAKLMQQFADNLSETVLGPGTESSDQADGVDPRPESASIDESAAASGAEPTPAQSPSAPSAGPRSVDAPDVEPIDLLDAAGGSVLRRMAPAVVLAVVLLLVIRALRRSS